MLDSAYSVLGRIYKCEVGVGDKGPSKKKQHVGRP